MASPTERRRIASGSPYEPVIGFSRALRVGERVLVAGTAPLWPDGSCDPDPRAQAARCLEIVLAVFAETRPVATMVVVAGLLDPRWRVEIEAEAVLGGAG
jgi:enamine deaminase RidA (YjgF/YER057c/UK114 family)